MILVDLKLMVVGEPEQGTKTHQDPETSQEGSLVLITPAGFGFRVGDFEGCPLAVPSFFVRKKFAAVPWIIRQSSFCTSWG